jgi:hypothetical protein
LAVRGGGVYRKQLPSQSRNFPRGPWHPRARPKSRTRLRRQLQPSPFRLCRHSRPTSCARNCARPIRPELREAISTRYSRYTSLATAPKDASSVAPALLPYACRTAANPRTAALSENGSSEIEDEIPAAPRGGKGKKKTPQIKPAAIEDEEDDSEVGEDE